MRKAFIIPMIIVLTASSALIGCGVKDPGKEPTNAEDNEDVVNEGEEYMEGGTVTRRDENAPKTIVSKEIKAFDAEVYLFTRFTSDDDRSFEFVIEQGDGGKLLASEKRRGISCAADDELLKKLQDIIDRYDLASLNGYYEVTAGLPPEYFPGGIDVDYASGEHLSFTENNDPYSPWATDMYDVFAEFFDENGAGSLYPDFDSEGDVTRFELHITKDGILTEYGGITVGDDKAIDGEKYLLMKSVYDFHKGEEISDEYVLFPDGFYEKIKEITSSYHLLRHYRFSEYDMENMDYGNHEKGFYGMGSGDHDEPDSEDDCLYIYMEYGEDHRVNIETRKMSEIEGFAPMTEELSEYLESLFRSES